VNVPRGAASIFGVTRSTSRRKTMRRLSLLSLSVCLLAAACGGHDRSLDIVSSTPSGTVAGSTWTMSKASVTRSGDTLSITLLGDSNAADCATSSDSMGYLIFSTPATVSKRELQLDLFDLTNPDNQTVTFVTPPSNNNISTDGIINITAVSDTSVSMGLLANAGTDNINGTFSTSFCQ
jgi:hypothetical protein